MSRWRLPLVGALAALAIGALLYNREPPAPVTAQAPTALPAIVENVKTTAATATESIQRGASLALTEQDARAWIDKPIYSSDGQKLGEVVAFLRTADNKVSELQANIGGFLGIGEHRIRLAPSQFSLHSDRVVLDLTAAQAKELPKIQKWVSGGGRMSAPRKDNAIDKHGKPLWVHKYVSLLRDASGEPTSFIVLVIDITEQKRQDGRIKLLMSEVNHRSKNLSCPCAAQRRVIGFPRRRDLPDRYDGQSNSRRRQRGSGLLSARL